MAEKQTPLEVLYQKLFDLLKAELKDWDKMKDGQFINLLVDDIKHRVSSADVPELCLVPEMLESNPHASSSNCSLTCNWTWFVATGTVQVPDLLKIQWACFRSMNKIFIDPPTWNGRTFVKRADMPTSSAGRGDPEKNRNIQGWSAVMSMAIACYFVTSEVMADGNA